MELAFGVSAYQRDRGNLPELPVVNMFVEKAPTETKQIALQSRPPLVLSGQQQGVGPITGIFKKDGVFNGDTFVVSGGNLYRVGTGLLGPIAGSGHVSMAGNEIGLVINAGAGVYFYDGAALNLADFPDNANVCKVLELAGRFIALRSGTGVFYWTEVLANALVAGVLTFGGLAFATAENEPDQLVDAVVIDDKLILGGKETVEFWAKTGDNFLPFSPIEGLVYEKGVKATGCMAPFDNAAIFISNDGLVYRASNVPQRISDSGIEERLAGSATASIFPFFFEGHEFAAMRLDSETLVYDAQTQQWCEWATNGETNWAARCAAPGPIFGSALDGRTLDFGDDQHVELGGTLERRFRAGLPMDGGALSVNNLRLRTNPGHTTYSTGQYADPVVEMRYSRDGGFTWSEWRPSKLGSQGEFRRQVEWRALGMFDAPGVLVEFRVTDPVGFRVSGVAINEAGGGRSR